MKTKRRAAQLRGSSSRGSVRFSASPRARIDARLRSAALETVGAPVSRSVITSTNRAFAAASGKSPRTSFQPFALAASSSCLVLAAQVQFVSAILVVILRARCRSRWFGALSSRSSSSFTRPTGLHFRLTQGWTAGSTFNFLRGVPRHARGLVSKNGILIGRVREPPSSRMAPSKIDGAVREGARAHANFDPQDDTVVDDRGNTFPLTPLTVLSRSLATRSASVPSVGSRRDALHPLRRAIRPYFLIATNGTRPRPGTRAAQPTAAQ